MIPIGTLCIVVAIDPWWPEILGRQSSVVGHVDEWVGPHHHKHVVVFPGGEKAQCTRRCLLPVSPPPQSDDAPHRAPKELEAA